MPVACEGRVGAASRSARPSGQLPGQLRTYQHRVIAKPSLPNTHHTQDLVWKSVPCGTAGAILQGLVACERPARARLAGLVERQASPQPRHVRRRPQFGETTGASPDGAILKNTPAIFQKLDWDRLAFLGSCKGYLARPGFQGVQRGL